MAEREFFGYNLCCRPGRLRMLLWLMLTVILCGPKPALGQGAFNPIPSPGSEYGNIPDSLFSMQEYGPNPSASYIYTLKELEVTFGNDGSSIVAYLDYHVRIKVFDASAREASLVAIPYYFERGIEEVTGISAATHKQDGQRISLPDEAIRTININSRYNVKEFTMPQVEDGAVLEYRYRVKRRYIEELPDFHLANQAPTALARVAITYPGYIRYDTVVENFDGSIQHQTQRIDTSSVAKIFTIPQPDPVLREVWTARHIPAAEEEAFISSPDDYRGKLKFKMSEFGIPRQSLENSWDFVVAELRRNQNVLEAARNNTTARETGRAIRKEFERAEAAQDSIFRYVNSRSSFSGNRSPYSEMRSERVLSGESADQAAINQTLLAMLQGAGIEAYPMFISTRQYGQVNKSFPSFFQFNGQLVYSDIGGKPYFMDASFAHSQPNLIPVDTYNETGLLLKPDTYEWKDIKPAKSVFDIDIRLQAKLDRNGNLSGTVRAQSAGYPAQVIRQRRADGEPVNAIIKRAVFDGYGEVNLSDSELSQLRSFSKPVIFETNFSLTDYATSFSDGLEFRPMVVGFLMSNPFDEPSRDLPVTLDAPEKLDLVYEIRIPEGFAVEQGRQNRSIELPGAVFTEQYDINERLLRYEFHIDISRKRFEAELFPQLLKLYERWVELSNGKWLIRRE